MNDNSFSMIRPDDWHLHLRDGEALASVLPDTTRRFARAIVMPNLLPPIRILDDALAYRDRILAAIPTGAKFEPLMTLYLTENTSPADIIHAQKSGLVHAVKYYPAGATTNSDSGVTDLSRCADVFAAMQACGLPLLLHGEVTHADIDIFDREAVFIERHLQRIVDEFPDLKVVLEHITTKEGVDFVIQARDGVAGTLTAHHLLLNRNAMLVGGIRPHMYCLPVLKREMHRQALVAAATSGNPKFFLGTDSAPHARNAKETACGCAGMYTSHAGIELYAEVFEAAGAMDKLEAFASLHGPDFYGLPRNKDSITLHKKSWKVPTELALDKQVLVPFRAGETISWQLSD